MFPALFVSKNKFPAFPALYNMTIFNEKSELI
jgi:hypothetical protein